MSDQPSSKDLRPSEEIYSPKRGRPRSAKPRRRRVVVYLDDETYVKLLEASGAHDTSTWIRHRIEEFVGARSADE